MAAKQAKRPSTKSILDQKVWKGANWTVKHGELKRGRGHPGIIPQLFQTLAEKIPFEALRQVKAHLKKSGLRPNGVYVAHDSMGVARYIGRGNIFSRLETRYEAEPLALKYFSFYVVQEKKHEREIETLLIRAAGPQLHFNTKKKRVDVEAGNIKDYEAGTHFYERQRNKGPKPKKATKVKTLAKPRRKARRY